ncbi:ATP-binding protein [Allorhizobium sp. BGMRC 0089]|uniref:ATP-binding protein n=1 Tax=Allorhizobium sonneratiae TaxID=2934936 RepID=UPI0020345395|nr:ATP-binding protein [Allorhizobium sonneratiae]MCM2291677.1 ATP-binding protein [Allorhizobium sonneratiae]
MLKRKEDVTRLKRSIASLPALTPLTLRSLRFRLTLASVLTIGIALLLLWMAVGHLFIDYIVQQYRGEMATITDLVASRMRVENGRLEMPDRPSGPQFTAMSGGRYWEVITDDGRIFRSRSLWDVEIPAHDKTLQLPFGLIRLEGPGGDGILLVKSKLSLTEGKTVHPFIVYAGFPEADLLAPLDKHRARSRLVMMIAATLLFIGALLQASAILRPFVKLKEQVAQVRNGRIKRLDDSVPTEVLSLVEEINLLLREREKALEKARGRASDLAHGLKTPLTVLAQLVEALPARQREEAFVQIDLVRQRADRQLQAARLGVEQMLATDVESLIRKLVNVLDPVARSRDIDWTVNVTPGLSLEADAADLAEALGNILDNAVKWTHSLIAVSAWCEKDDVIITVSDDGPGVPEENRQQVLRRGQFLESEQGGSGLGLAICSDIVTAYGGSLLLNDSPIGGLLVRLSFPLKGGRRIPPQPV